MKMLFLDDYRWPSDCAKYMHKKLGPQNVLYTNPAWAVVRNYPDFVKWIKENGLPDLISFDHDLADGHYHQGMQEGEIDYSAPDFNEDYQKTGFHCAKFLVEYCMDNNKDLPGFIVHSMNPVGTQNIESLLANFKRSHRVDARSLN
jgi:hypothetical protein